MKAYFAEFDEDEGTGIAFVAKNAREAKAMAWRHGEYGGEYIDLHVRWIKKANVDGLPPGEVAATVDSVKRNIYCWIEDSCPRCGYVTRLDFIEDYNEVMCSGCEERAYESSKKADKP